MNIPNAIVFLSGLKYGERALTDKRIEHDEKLDQVCLLLNSFVERPDRVVDNPDCPNGVCPVR